MRSISGAGTKHTKLRVFKIPSLNIYMINIPPKETVRLFYSMFGWKAGRSCPRTMAHRMPNGPGPFAERGPPPRLLGLHGSPGAVVPGAPRECRAVGGSAERDTSNRCHASSNKCLTTSNNNDWSVRTGRPPWPVGRLVYFPNLPKGHVLRSRSFFVIHQN